MTDYLDRLEAELLRAGYDARRVPRLPAVLIGAVIAIVAVVIAASIGGGEIRERPAQATPTPRPTSGSYLDDDLPAPPPELRGVTVGVVNATTVPGLAQDFLDRMRAAGWTVAGPVNAADQRNQSSYVAAGATNADNRNGTELAETFSVGAASFDPKGALHALGIDASVPDVSDVHLFIVLGQDAAPIDPTTTILEQGPGFTIVRKPGPELCLQVRSEHGPPSSGCAQTGQSRFRIAIVDVNAVPGKWLVYGLTDPQARAVRLPDDTTTTTHDVQRVPGRFFSAVIDPAPAVHLEALDAGNGRLETLGRRTPADEPSVSFDDAREKGDLAGFAPSGG